MAVITLCYYKAHVEGKSTIMHAIVNRELPIPDGVDMYLVRFLDCLCLLALYFVRSSPYSF